MSTDIPSKKKIKDKIPVFSNYQGKQDEANIVNISYLSFEKSISVNGNEDNAFFSGDNYDVLLYMINNGYKEKINLIYIDHPFATSATFLNSKQEKAYSDSLCGGEENMLSF